MIIPQQESRIKSDFRSIPAKKFDKKSENDPQSCGECGYALYPNCGECTNHECKTRRRNKPRVLSMKELVTRYAEPALIHGRAWGDWTLDAERWCLVFRAYSVELGDGSGRSEGVPRYTAFHGLYEVDLERVRDSAALLDWIYQINSKTWATARVTKDLLNALEDVFHPQRNLCSGACISGSGGQVIKNPGAFLRERIHESERKVAA